ncbi:polyprenyl synthetase family protein [Streptomyces sp. NPDC014894]|uniref:polyprenyl synthetase family protein n=1 Tax=unclassified Streptomyces TaxID=2593676 RepID=UPI0036FE255E
MSTQMISPGPFCTSAATEDVNTVISDFLAEKKENCGHVPMVQLLDALAAFMESGKRIRPVLLLTGRLAVGGEHGGASAVRVAASLEMFHAFALIHDDIMDGSDTRRGRPTIHRAFAGEGGDGRGERFGAGAAVLLGDLAFAWSDELLHTAGLDSAQYAAVMPLIAEMRSEVMLGQYLDLRATGELTDDVEATLTVSRYKTAKYTIERPLHIGAALAGAGPETMAACTAFALPLGEAFQLRDDMLGVYGDVRDTGKSRLDDLRAAKNTTLVALALSRCDSAQEARLRTLIGDPRLDEAGAGEVRAIFEVTGARSAVERMIEDRYREALRVLDTAPFAAEATAVLHRIARTATRRNT